MLMFVMSFLCIDPLKTVRFQEKLATNVFSFTRPKSKTTLEYYLGRRFNKRISFSKTNVVLIY